MQKSNSRFPSMSATYSLWSEAEILICYSSHYTHLCLPFLKDAKIRQDGSFRVLDHSTGYPINWDDWYKFYVADEGGTLQEELADKSFAVHYWNHMRGHNNARWEEEEILINPNHLLYKIFKAYCPSTERNILQNLIGSKY